MQLGCALVETNVWANVEMGVEIVLNRGVTDIGSDQIVNDCVYIERTQNFASDAVVMVASRNGNDDIYTALKKRESEWADAGIKSVKIFGDAEAPGPIRDIFQYRE